MKYSEISHFSHPEHKLKFEYSEFPFKCDGCNEFLTVPPGDLARYCNVCEKDVSGFVYHCRSCGYDLHPCCAKLPMVLDDGEIKLYLYRKARLACHRCERKGRSWSYRSEYKKYSLHVACVREMIVESWYEIYREGNKGKGLGMMRILRLKNTLQSSHGSGGKSKGS
ncbi:hypothetical protein K1719_010269 [Acacia pycnantha]|nr:hypothetical protein K1719_010269 [Acacia pycnantha]